MFIMFSLRHSIQFGIRHPSLCQIAKIFSVPRQMDRNVSPEIKLNLKEKYDLKKMVLFEKIVNDVYSMRMSVCSGNLLLDQVENKNKFEFISNQICDSIEKFPNSQIITLLQSFLMMNVKPESKVVQYLENELLWRARKLSFQQLLKCISFHYKYQETKLQKKVFNELLLLIQLNFGEAQTSDEIIKMLKLLKYFTDESKTKIEETVLTLITQTESKKLLDFNSLCYLLVILARTKRRPTPLIRAAVNQLLDIPNEEIGNIKPANIINTISALKSLNFPDENLLKKLVDLLCNMDFLSKVNSSSKRELLISISLLNWCYPKLFDSFLEKLIFDPSLFTNQDIISYVLATARLNYKSSLMDEAFDKQILPMLNKDAVSSNSQWLTVVWSLAILGLANPNHIESVLNEQFFKCLNNELNSNEVEIAKIKLMNIKGVADLELNLKTSFLLDINSAPKKSKELELFETSVVEMLNFFLPKEKYMKNNLLSPYGFTITAEFITNASIVPLSLDEYGVLGGGFAKLKKPLPLGYKRNALLVVGFNETLLNGSGLIGVNELTKRLLQRMGYTVIFVNQKYLSTNTTAIKKVQYLQNLIKIVINES